MQFRLMSPGTGAYRVQLSQVSGEEAAEAVLAGEGDEMRVDLPPGEYWGRILELGQPAGSGRRFKLQLRPNEPQLRLPSISTGVLPLSPRSRPLDPVIRSTRLPRTLQLEKSGSRESYLSAKVRLIAAPSQLPITSIDVPAENLSVLRGSQDEDGGLSVAYRSLGFELEKQDLYDRAVLRAIAKRVPFVIGVSEDRSPKKRGSWTRPSLVQISTERMEGGFRFRFNQCQESMPEGGYRVRMTLGIAGVPAIRIPVPIYADGSIVEVRPIRIDGQLDFAVEIKAISERVQALIAALTELPGEEALKILRWNAESRIEHAIEILAEKRRDLWAATAAALLLVKARRLEGVEQWLLNLFRLAPHIADAAIAAAWARAAQEAGSRRRTEQLVMDSLTEGLSVGAPTFSVGNSLALEILNALRSTARSQEVQTAARDAYLRVARRSQYKIYRGPYMLWEQTGSQLQSGRLLGPRYLELVRGAI